MNAYFFVPLLALTWAFGFVVTSVAGHYFLSIVESSATGLAQNVPWKGRPFRAWRRDDIDWPDEPFTDWILKGFFLGYLVLLWAAPAMLIGRYAMGDSQWTTVVTGAVFWLGFPIGVLSSLSSDSRWNPFWPPLFIGFLKRPLKVLGFYLMSAPLLAVIWLLFDMLLLHTSKATVKWAMALAPVAVLCFFIYGRLLGRLGFVLTFVLPASLQDEKRPTVKRKKRRPSQAFDAKHRWGIPTEEVEHEAPNPIVTSEGEVTGYEVDYVGRPIEEVAKPAAIIHKFDDEDDRPITVEPLDERPNPERTAMAAKLAEPPQHILDLYLRHRPTEPTNPYGSATVTFLFDPKTIDPWAKLTLGLLGLALLQRALDALPVE